MENQGSNKGESGEGGGSAVAGWAGIPAVTKYVIFAVGGLFVGMALVYFLK